MQFDVSGSSFCNEPCYVLLTDFLLCFLPKLHLPVSAIPVFFVVIAVFFSLFLTCSQYFLILMDWQCCNVCSLNSVTWVIFLIFPDPLHTSVLQRTDLHSISMRVHAISVNKENNRYNFIVFKRFPAIAVEDEFVCAKLCC